MHCIEASAKKSTVRLIILYCWRKLAHCVKNIENKKRRKTEESRQNFMQAKQQFLILKERVMKKEHWLYIERQDNSLSVQMYASLIYNLNRFINWQIGAC